MELGEATALAGTFITSVLFRAHGLPLNERSKRAVQWWRESGSRVPLRPALEERRRHLARFASRRRSDRRRDREVYLTISAIVDGQGNGPCPALRDGRCGIYEARPLTCRTVPLHYSRPPSTLQAYLDRFTATPGHACDVTTSPIILDGNAVLSPELRRDRERAAEAARADRTWKEHLLARMDDPALADQAGLPTYDAVLENTDNGYATLAPMIAAWRVAEAHGLLSPQELRIICERQAALMRAEIARSPAGRSLADLLPLYNVGAAGPLAG